MMNIFKRKSTLPKIHWKDITIARHKAILEVYKKYENDPEDALFAYDLATAVYGKEENWMDDMKVSEANEWVSTLAFVNERPKPRTAKGEYILNGHKYKVTMNMQNITTNQFIDFQQMADQSREHPAEFLSILLIPKGHKYNDGYSIEDVVYDIENYMSVEDCMGLSAFFFKLLQISIRRSIRSLRKLEHKARKEGIMTEEQLQALQRISDLLESANGLRQ